MTMMTNQQQHGLSSTLIDELIEERQQVWSLYCKVADYKPFSSNQKLPTLINEFCQILIDYISLGHFGIYQHIVDGGESRSEVVKTAESVYNKIAETTAAALNFNDKYVQNCITVNLSNLEQDLSILGENLALRNDVEDLICGVIMH